MRTSFLLTLLAVICFVLAVQAQDLKVEQRKGQRRLEAQDKFVDAKLDKKLKSN